MIGKDRKILVIDDEPRLRISLRDYLEDCGFTVFEASDGSSGIDKFIEIKPDIALIDLKMPGLSGHDVIKTLHKDYPHTPLVVISGTGILEEAIEAIRNGAWDYISKPIIDMVVLEHVIERAFEKAALIRENRNYQNQLETLVKERTYELQNANRELYKLNERLHGIVETTCALQGFDKINTFGRYLLEKFGNHMDATGGSFFLYKRDGLKLIHTIDLKPFKKFIPFPLKKDSILQKALDTKEPQIIKDTDLKSISKRNGFEQYQDGSFIVFPLTDTHRKNVGILTLHRKYKPTFTEQDKEIGSILSSFSSEAIRAINYIEDIRKREQYFRILAKGIGGFTDKEFFNSIASSCVSIFETEYAFLGKIEGDRIHSVAYIDNGKFSEISLDTDKGFAALVLKNDTYSYCVNTGDFTVDPVLSQMNIKSYIGLVIKDNKGKPTGILSTFSRYKIDYPEYWREILELMASKYISVTDLIKADQEQARLKENLQQAQKMEAIGTLAGGIAHDFNNILSPILGYSEMILYSVDDNDPVKTDIEQIKNAGIRAKDLVQQILSFSRQKEVKAKPVEIQIIAREVVKMLKSTLPVTIKIMQNIQNDCYPVHADPTQLHQVIMNLCTNSFHAMEKKGGVLTVVTENTEVTDPSGESKRFVKLVVEDTGIGMDEEVVERIYEPYFTTKKEGKGTGLGLAVTHGIVISCGGFIDIESEKGKGTKFSIFFPVAEAFQSRDKKNERSIEKGSESIMLVDDQIPILRVLSNVLKSLGYKTTSFENPVEALSAFKNNPDDFDMIITDQTMPELTGDKLATEVLGINSELPIILCTGYSSIMTREKALAVGIREFMAKPVEMNELAAIIRDIFDAKKHDNIRAEVKAIEF